MGSVHPFFLEFAAIEFGLRAKAQEGQEQRLIQGLLALDQQFPGMIGMGHILPPIKGVLSAGIMNVGSEENFAASALASAWLETHRPKSGKKTEPANQQKSQRHRRKNGKKEEKVSARISNNPRETGFPSLLY